MITNLFNIDSLSISIIALVALIGASVANFASRYMKGDDKYSSFFINLIFVILSVIIMVIADNLILLFTCLALCNLLMVRMMIHKSSWIAAKNSGILTSNTYLFSLISIGFSFLLLYKSTGYLSIKDLVQENPHSYLISFSLILLALGAMAQSAIWPFHKWLISSLNSPTPVSAIMHAGIINSGGFLLVKFAPLYTRETELLNAIFIIGMITAVLGTFWKLIQSDVKRMLACSTMSQMGLMMAQIGLGLFAAAIAHLIFHGMFKAYLFLASGGAAQEKRVDLFYPPKILSFICALICGFAGVYGFSFASNKVFFAQDSSLVLSAICFVASCQFALPIVREKALIKLPISLIATFLVGAIYGKTVHMIEYILTPLNLMHPQELNLFHIIAIIALISCWISMLFYSHNGNFMIKFYVKALNASQAHPSTITANRNQYKYL